MTMGKTRVLFVCVHNSARSQMAEAFLNGLAGDKFVAESAGLSPQKLNPLVIAVMQESGFDLSGKKANSLFEYYKDGRLYDYVITVCDESVEERCPLFPGVRKRLYWPFQDPAALQGSQEEKLAETRKIRDAIKSRIEEWIHEFD
jgi:arsenate reductase